MSANCKSCGRIMTKPEDYSDGNIESPYCSSCTNADGSLKSLDEITLHIANQLIMSQGIDREAATKAARSILSVQPQWRERLRVIEAKKTWKSKFLLIGLSVLLIISVGVVWLVGPKDKVYYWDVPIPTDKVLGYDVKPEYVKTNRDGIEITQISIPEDQYNARIDKNDGYIYFGDYVHSQTGYRIEFDKRPFESSIAVKRVAVSQHSNFLYIGSVASSFSAENLRLFWVTTDEKNNWILIEGMGNSDQYEEIARNVDPFSVVICGIHVVWIQKDNSVNGYCFIKAFNTQTSKIFEIDAPKGFKSDLKAGKNVVFWSDYGDQSKLGFEVIGYDFLTKSKIIPGMQSVYSGEKPNDSKFLGTLEGKRNRFLNNIPDNWFVAGDYVYMSDYNDLTNIITFDYVNKLLSNLDCGYNASSWKSRRILSANDNRFYLYDMVTDDLLGSDFRDGNNNQRIAWLDKIDLDKNKMKYSVSTMVISSKRKEIKRINLTKNNHTYIDLLKITGDWLVWATEVDEQKQESILGQPYNQLIKIICTNLETGKQIDIGDYDIRSSPIDLDAFNGLLTWKAWNGETQNDIYFCKLPEGK